MRIAHLGQIRDYRISKLGIGIILAVRAGLPAVEVYLVDVHRGIVDVLGLFLLLPLGVLPLVAADVIDL